MTLDLRDRLTLYRTERTPDAGGGAATARAPIASLWGEATALPAVRETAGEKDAFRRRYTVRLRTEDYTREASHLDLHGIRLRIQSAAPAVGGAPFTILTCEEAHP
ncbi:MAG: head-tail adaptor protein [Pseudomonadota bacterium]